MEMLVEVLVCYDVQDNRRRQRLMEALKDLGLTGVQKSVFWGFLNLSERKSLPQLFKEHLDETTDTAFCVPARISGGDILCTFGYPPETFAPPKVYDVI